jgi:hypothetical protein
MKTESSAATQTFNIVNRTLARGEVFNVTDLRDYRSGDVINFHLFVSQSQAGSSIRFGIVNSTHVFVQSQRVTLTVPSNGLQETIQFTMPVESSGRYRIRIENANSALTGGTISVSGSCTHRPRIDYNITNRYDDTARTFLGTLANTIIELNGATKEATDGFSQFGIFFGGNVSLINTNLDGGSCSKSCLYTLCVVGLSGNGFLL